MQLAQKIKEEEALIFKNTLFEFNFAIINQDLPLVASYLHDNGMYFGQSKSVFLGTLVSLFHSLTSKQEEYPTIHKGISLEQFAGCDVYEIRFSSTEEVNHFWMFDDEKGAKNMLGKPLGDDGKCIRYVAGSKDGKLFRLYNPKKFILIEDLKEHQTNN